MDGSTVHFPARAPQKFRAYLLCFNFLPLTLIIDFKTSTLTFNKILVLVHLVLVLLVTPE